MLQDYWKEILILCVNFSTFSAHEQWVWQKCEKASVYFSVLSLDSCINTPCREWSSCRRSPIFVQQHGDGHWDYESSSYPQPCRTHVKVPQVL
jgi:hypothetical protein